MPDQRGRRIHHGALTERQRDVLTHAATGLTNKEIAAVMHMSPEEVKDSLEAVYALLGVKGRK